MFDAGAQNSRLDREERARLLIGIAIKGEALTATGSPEAQPLIEPQESAHTRTTPFPPCVNYDAGGAMTPFAYLRYLIGGGLQRDFHLLDLAGKGER